MGEELVVRRLFIADHGYASHDANLLALMGDIGVGT